MPSRDRHAALRGILALLDQGIRYIELRDDLLSEEELLWFARQIPSRQLLLSLRQPLPDPLARRALLEQVTPALLDVAQECSPAPAAACAQLVDSVSTQGVISCHTRDSAVSLASQLEGLSARTPSGLLIKAALPIHNLAELATGHRWHLQSPQRNLFLPISSDGTGRFRFYRLLRGEKLRLGFLRDEAAPMVADQPSPKEWSLRHELVIPELEPIPFAAILGDPVEHSRTPEHHAAFFSHYGLPVLKVRVTEEDIQSGDVFSLLRDVGLRAAAVTSPHKQWLRDAITTHNGQWEVIDPRDPQTAGNTLVFRADGTAVAASTDGVGLRSAWQQIVRSHFGNPDSQLPTMAVFGGGGLLPLLQAVFPQAVFLSARTGLPRDPQMDSAALASISVLIWSVGRSRFVLNPPEQLRPQLIFDLNYSADSPSRDYAREVGGVYVDGSTFFCAQAEAQQTFWQRHLPPPSQPTPIDDTANTRKRSRG